MPVPHWEDPVGWWDVLVLGDRAMPGVWTARCTPRRNLDVKKSKGRDGARIKDQGYEPARVELQGKLISEEAWDELVKRLGEIHPKKPGGAREPLYVYHPSLAAVRVQNVYIEEIDSPQVDAEGICAVAIRALEWVPEPKKTKQRAKAKESLGEDVLDLPPPSLDKLSNLPT